MFIILFVSILRIFNWNYWNSRIDRWYLWQTILKLVIYKYINITTRNCFNRKDFISLSVWFGFNSEISLLRTATYFWVLSSFYSLYDIVELAICGHMTKSARQLESSEKILLFFMDRNYNVINFALKYLYLRMPGAAIFADIIKLQPCLLKHSLKTKKVKKIKNYLLICNLYLYFLIFDIIKVTD